MIECVSMIEMKPINDRDETRMKRFQQRSLCGIEELENW